MRFDVVVSRDGLTWQFTVAVLRGGSTRLFDVAVAATSDAIEEAGAAVEHLRHLGKLYKCSLAFEDDPAARWNHVSTNIRLAQREGDTPLVGCKGGPT